MSELSIELHWHRVEPGFEPGNYSAEHVVRYNNSYEVQVDAAPIPNRRSPRRCRAAI